MLSICLGSLLALTAAQSEPVELLGLEYLPGWLRPESATDATARANVAPGAGMVRMGTSTWGWFYWTAGLVGYGQARYGARATDFYFFGTEFGFRLLNRDRHQLRLGLGVGVSNFDYALQTGNRRGSPPAIGFGWSPTLRYAFRLNNNFSAGVGLRALTVTPGDNSPGGLAGAFVHVGWSTGTATVAKRFGPRLEIIALELMPWWIRSRRSGVWSPAATGLPGAALVRLGTLKWTHVYWVPVVTGFGIAGAGADTPTAFLIFATEVGGIVLDQGGHSLRLGLGVGGGVFEFAFVTDTNSAGPGLILTPSVRYGYQVHANFFLGVGIRALTILPNTNSPGMMGGLFFDVGWSVLP